MLLDERQVNAFEHMRTNQNHIKREFDKRAKIHEFNIGDIVLKKYQQTSQMERQLHDKFSTNWLGPYIIKKKYGSGAYHLADMEGNEEREPINITHLRPFYS